MISLKAEIEGRMAYLEPQVSYLKLLREELPEDGIFVSELTQVGYVSRSALPVYEPHTYLSLGYQGTLGGGFAIALGAKVAQPNKPVLSIAGDGGFMFTMPELATAVQHQISTVTIIFNDGAYGNVQRMQRQNYGGKVIATDLNNPDFVKLAESFGAQGLRAESYDDLRRAIRRGFETHGPTLIDVPVGVMPDPWDIFFPARNRPPRR
jgi:acetolactate synthase-1/2/3 large subunit